MLKGSNPLAWSHAGYSLEVTEKRRLGAEARRGDIVREYEERAQAMGASIIRRH